MKKILLLIGSLTLGVMVQAQITKATFKVDTAGTLSKKYDFATYYHVSNMTVSGRINASDFAYIKKFSYLDTLDLSGITIDAYSGSDGTLAYPTAYNANELPSNSFLCPMTSINLSATITTIKESSFYGCCAFVTIDSQNPNYVSINGNVFSKDMTSQFLYYHRNTDTSYTIPSTVISIKSDAFAGSNSLKTVKIPSSVISLSSEAFTGCTGLTTISIPSSVNYIGTYAFSNDTSLRSMYVYDSVPITLGSTSQWVFNGMNLNACVLYVPLGSKTRYSTANQWKDFVNIQEFVGFDEKAGSRTVSVTATGNWTLSSDVPWLTVTPASGSGNGSYTITAQPNTTTYDRKGTITFSSDATATLKGQTVQTIVVYQKAGATTAVAEINSLDVQLYPNPATSEFTVSVGKEADIELVSINGVILLHKHILDKETVSVASLPAGLYFVKIINSTGVVTKTIIVTK